VKRDPTAPGHRGPRPGSVPNEVSSRPAWCRRSVLARASTFVKSEIREIRIRPRLRHCKCWPCDATARQGGTQLLFWGIACFTFALQGRCGLTALEARARTLKCCRIGGRVAWIPRGQREQER
jgi:hypothetical protein